MSDDVDLAQRFEELRRDRALGAVLAQAQALNTSRPARTCLDCAEPIEAERLAAAPGARRCFTCQEAVERPRHIQPWGRRCPT